MGKKPKDNIYQNMQWNSLADYYSLGKKYDAWGSQLGDILKKERGRKVDLIPQIKDKK